MLGVFFHLNAEVATRIGISPPALNGVNMGLIRYLRRRLHIQQLNDVCDSIHQITDQCLKEICSNSGIQAKLDQTIAGQQELLKGAVEAASAKLEQISALQLKVNDTEFSRRSQILFADNRYWEDNFYKSIKGIDIEEKYDRLVNGLSDADRSVVDSITQTSQFQNELKHCFI